VHKRQEHRNTRDMATRYKKTGNKDTREKSTCVAL